jgi:hypothetical protein
MLISMNSLAEVLGSQDKCEEGRADAPIGARASLRIVSLLPMSWADTLEPRGGHAGDVQLQLVRPLPRCCLRSSAKF